jgi:hypothetical protein
VVKSAQAGAMDPATVVVFMIKARYRRRRRACVCLCLWVSVGRREVTEKGKLCGSKNRNTE